MKKLVLIYTLSILGVATVKAQFSLNGDFGVTVAGTNYITDTNTLFTKSRIGYSFGVLGTIYGDNDDLYAAVGIKYNRHRSVFIGKESEEAAQEDVNVNLSNFEIPITFNYHFYKFDEFSIGVNAGTSFNLIYEWKISDDSQESYLLEPLLITGDDLLFDTNREEISLNMFLIGGISVRYDYSYMLNFQYHYGITDPYRHTPFFSRIFDIEGQDSYFSVEFTYFFGT